MRTITSVLCAVALFANVPQAHAQAQAQQLAPSETAAGFLESCRDAATVREQLRLRQRDFNDTQFYNFIQCESFIEGFIGGYGSVIGGRRLACLPASLTLMQVRDIYIAFASQHPEYYDRNRADILHVALAATYPCPGG